MHCVYEVDDCSYSNILANINMTFDKQYYIFILCTQKNLLYCIFKTENVNYINFFK